MLRFGLLLALFGTLGDTRTSVRYRLHILTFTTQHDEIQEGQDKERERVYSNWLMASNQLAALYTLVSRSQEGNYSYDSKGIDSFKSNLRPRFDF